MAQWRDTVREAFYDRWQRRGELMATAGLTAVFTWLAAAVPTAHTTHVNIWPPLAFGGVIGVVGVYAILAAEIKSWWLPGRKRIEDTSEGRWMAHTAEWAQDQMGVSRDAREVANALRSLGQSVQQIAERLSPEGSDDDVG